MLIIDDRIVIVHLRKAGGTSFCRGLIDLLPAERVSFYGYTKAGEVRSQASHKEGGLWKHSPARDYFEKRNVRKDGQIVIVVSARPYVDRVASFYVYARRRNQMEAGVYSWCHELSFSEYLRSKYLNRDSISRFARATDGELLADCVVPFEQMADRFDSLSRHLGVGGGKLPHLNVNGANVEAYRDMYSSEDLAFVDGLFERDRTFLEANRQLLENWPF